MISYKKEQKTLYLNGKQRSCQAQGAKAVKGKR